MKKKFSLILVLNLAFCSLLFVACANKNEKQSVEELKKQILIYSQKAQFIYNGESSVFVLSYLNPILEKESQRDIFVLTVSPKQAQIQGLTVFMDENAAEISPLNEDDELKKFIINTEYSSHFKLSFPFKEAPLINVKLCLEPNCVELDFQKYSKSLYYRSVDVNTQYN